MVTDHRAKSRFELPVDGHMAFAEYRREQGNLVITHVFTPPELRGGGIASQLMAHIVETIRTEGLRLVPVCSYAAAWIERHPEHRDLIHTPH